MNASVSTESPIAIGEILLRAKSALWNQRIFVAMLVIGIVVATCVVLLILPRTYLSEAKLYVRVGREVTLDPTVTTGQTFSVNQDRENEINSVLQIISSEAILDAVVKQIGADVILNDSSPDRLQARTVAHAQDAEASSEKEGTPLPHTDHHRKAVRQLRKMLDSDSIKRSSIIEMSCVAASPELAQQILSAFTEIAVSYHSQSNRTSGSYEFFERQTELVERQYLNAANELSQAKNEVAVTSLEDRRRNMQQQYSTLETNILNTESELVAAKASVEMLQALLDETPRELETQFVTGLPDDAIGSTARTLNTLKIREQELLSKYSERHPLVMSVREQMQRATELLDGDNDAPRQQTVALNPAYQQIEKDFINAQSSESVLSARLEKLKEQKAELETGLADLNNNYAKIHRLQQKVDLLEESYVDYSKKLEQSRIDQELNQQRISNINVVQPATFDDKPISPQRRLIAGFSLIFATGLAMIVAWFREYGWNWESSRREALLVETATV